MEITGRTGGNESYMTPPYPPGITAGFLWEALAWAGLCGQRRAPWHREVGVCSFGALEHLIQHLPNIHQGPNLGNPLLGPQFGIQQCMQHGPYLPGLCCRWQGGKAHATWRGGVPKLGQETWVWVLTHHQQARDLPTHAFLLCMGLASQQRYKGELVILYSGIQLWGFTLETVWKGTLKISSQASMELVRAVVCI